MDFCIECERSLDECQCEQREETEVDTFTFITAGLVFAGNPAS